MGWGYLSLEVQTHSLKNGSIINPNASYSFWFWGTYYGGDSPDISVMETQLWERPSHGLRISGWRRSRYYALRKEAGVISYFAAECQRLLGSISRYPAGIEFVPLNDVHRRQAMVLLPLPRSVWKCGSYME